MTTDFNTDIKYLKGVGEKRAEQLYNSGIDTIGALLRFYPRAYSDFTHIIKISDTKPGEKAVVRAKIITEIDEQFIRKNMTLYKYSVSDGTGNMFITIFNNKYLAARLHKGSEYIFAGKLADNSFLPAMSSPEIRESGDNSIHPIYKQSGKITTNLIEKLVKNAFNYASIGTDILPPAIREEYGITDYKTALHNIHFPADALALQRAKYRFVFEELLTLRAGLMLIKGKRKSESSNILKTDFSEEFYSLLPFSPTDSQRRVVSECIEDMKSGVCMNRLVEGDVGSGKTAVAAALVFSCAKCGIQSAFMAPTEILSIQHFNNLSALFKNTDIKCALITGATRKKERAEIINAVKQGEIHILVGTQALLSDDISFNRLGLVITDEQHRFGVAQRAKLASKGSLPHCLVMSATPIPQTLGLIVFGDLDISRIDKLPGGRQPIECYVIDSSIRQRAFGYIKKHLCEGRQGYIVCPAVEENENSDCLSAEQYYKRITENEFKDYRVGLLHGKMKPKQKDEIMKAFSSGEIQLLVSTTVIEVGIDVPNAAIMLIENAEMFGLSTLHQLRGRIGRGQYKSTCILLSDNKSPTCTERLDVIKNNSNGFVIAEEDLRLRGPGDFLGSRQHGLPELKIADIFADRIVLSKASEAAAKILSKDPKLKNPENAPLKREIIALYKRLK